MVDWHVVVVLLLGVCLLDFLLAIAALGLRLLLVVVGRPLLDHNVLPVVEVADFREVRQKVRPHDMVLVDVGALDLAHGDEMIG